MDHIHIDINEVEAMIAKGNEVMAPMAEKDGIRGAYARLSCGMGAAFARQLAVEINRGTSVEHLQQALAMNLANFINDLNASSHDDPKSPLVRLDSIKTLQMVGHFIVNRDKGQTFFSASVEPSKAGRA